MTAPQARPSRTHARRRRARTAVRLGVAALLSAGAHALLLLVPEPPRPPPGPPPEAIELTVVHLPPPAPETPPPPPSTRPAAPAPRRSPPGARATSPEAQAPAARGSAGSETSPERLAGDGVWREGAAPDLRLHAPGAPAPSAGEGDRLAVVPLKEKLEARLEGMFARDRAELRAREQRDAYWFDIEKRLRHGFEVEGDVVARARGVPSGPLGTVRDVAGPVADALRDWVDQAARYGGTGNPYGDGDVPGGDAGLAERLRLQASLVGELAAPGGTFRQALATLVLVEQDDAGLVVNVELWRTSGSGSFDRAALAQARGLQNLPPPPEQGQASLWSFEAERSVTPPLPMVGCGFDATFAPTECTWPLREHLRTKVRLVAVFAPGELRKIRRAAP